jgi:transcriptional regulator with XRE-family HTH domain
MNELHPVRRWREDTGTTLAQLAGRVNVTPSHLSEIERGLSDLSTGLARRISAATGLGLEDVVATAKSGLKNGKRRGRKAA